MAQLQIISILFVILLFHIAKLQAQNVDIIQTARNENLATLVTALTAADLVPTLQGPGPFTVFAPNDAAFGKLPNGVVNDLLTTPNKATLSKILQYHVTNKNLTSAEILAMPSPTNLTMLAGGYTVVSSSGSTVKVNEGLVLKADVFATNGIIHVLDSVLLPPLDIVETAVTNGLFKTLVTAIRAADLEATLKGPGPFTVFAPTDAAFDKLPNGTIADLLKPENKDKLANILKYHVISGRVSAADISGMNLPVQVNTVANIRVIADKNGNAVKVNGATVTTPDVSNTNGLIHIIDTVLLPPTDIVQTAIDAKFNTLATALTAADLVTALKGPGPFTVFAPNDAAFDKLPSGVVNDLLTTPNKPTLSKILQYHVTNTLITTGAIGRMTLPSNVTMLAGGYTTVSKAGDTVMVNDANIIIADVFNTNGMIHAIDSVLLPPFDIVETAVTSGIFKTLVTAIRAADLEATLKGPGPFTVFAPTDAAFDKLPNGTIADLLKPENKDKLANILKYHVISGRVSAADISGMNLPVQVNTVANIRVIADKNGNAVKVNGATVTTPDVSNTNGLIHIIDTVLLPPTDIVQTAIDAKFNTLATALTAADLVTALKRPGPFTVFAPNDAAFDKLPSGVVNDLLTTPNKPTLSKILQYHVTNTLITTGAIGRMTLPSNVTMLAGGYTTVSKAGDTVKVNNAAVILPDVFNTNGMIHAIDSVLLPPFDVVETAVTNGIFKTLVTAIRAAGLEATLKGPGPFTVFAPTDAAFNKLPNGTITDLLKPENKEKLAKILKYHVIGKRVSSADINEMKLPAKVEMLGGDVVTVKKEGNTIKINDATVTTADVANTNGLIHIIDTVLMPVTSSAMSFYLNQMHLTILASVLLFAYQFFL